jgi:hypothetical protein
LHSAAPLGPHLTLSHRVSAVYWVAACNELALWHGWLLADCAQITLIGTPQRMTWKGTAAALIGGSGTSRIWTLMTERDRPG